MEKPLNLQKTPKIVLLLFMLFSSILTSIPTFATNPPLASDEFGQTVEEILNSPKNEYLDPLGATENNQRVKEQKEKNNTITIICLIVMIFSGIGVAIIFFHPLFHHKKKKILPKF